MKLENVTSDVSPAPTGVRRWYDDACGSAHAMELVGERWSLLIIREMMFGPRRFGDMRAALRGLSANVLTQRLETLERHGIVSRSKLAPPASAQVYGLTEWGAQADQLLMVLGAWAARSPGHDPTLPLSKTSLMLSFRTMFRPEVCDVAMTVGFRFGEETFRVRIEGGNLTPTRAGIEDADVTFAATPESMASYVYGKVPLAKLERDGAILTKGDREMAMAFQTFFTMPAKVERPVSKNAGAT